MAKSFRELRVWNMTVDLSVSIYNLTADFPKHEVYGLSSQMRRAAVPIASNIAEGCSRGTRKDFKQFVTIARGSNSELQTQLLIAGRLKYATPEGIKRVEVETQEISQMLSGLSKYLSSPPETKRPADKR
jgi:four helix bundle protein